MGVQNPGECCVPDPITAAVAMTQIFTTMGAHKYPLLPIEWNPELSMTWLPRQGSKPATYNFSKRRPSEVTTLTAPPLAETLRNIKVSLSQLIFEIPRNPTTLLRFQIRQSFKNPLAYFLSLSKGLMLSYTSWLILFLQECHVNKQK